MPIKKIIAFGSAKGGVGKSSITASLALSLSKHKKIGILDADVYGPNQNILFNLDKKNKIAINIIGYISPGLTSSLALGEKIMKMVKG